MASYSFFFQRLAFWFYYNIVDAVIFKRNQSKESNSNSISATESGGGKALALRDNKGVLIQEASFQISDDTRVVDTKLELMPVDRIVRSLSPFSDNHLFGSATGVGIKIVYQGDLTISDCVGTLESLERYIVVNGKFEKAMESPLWEPPSGKLRWRNHPLNKCETTIAPDSKDQTILVAELINAVSVFSEKDRSIFNPVKGMWFALCDTSKINTYIQMNSLGIYQIEIRINGKIGRHEMQVNRFSGYVYYYPDGFYIRDGDFMGDERVLDKLRKE